MLVQDAVSRDAAGMAVGRDPSSAVEAKPRERVFTWPLVVFLTAVALIDVVSLWRRSVLPGPADAIVLLGDGDLDGDERQRVLRALVERGRASTAVAEQWGAMLAAIPLEDRAAYDAIRTGLGLPGPGAKVPPPTEREFLHLGDPLLANVLAATLAETDGRKGDAVQRWQQVTMQCLLMHRPLAQEIATDALRRLQ